MYATKLQKIWKDLSLKLKEPTRICRVCFKPIKSTNLQGIFQSNPIICSECISSMKPIFAKHNYKNINQLMIYSNNEETQALLFQIKDCLDVELAKVFINPFLLELRPKYSGYTIVPFEWNYNDIIRREFDYLYEIFCDLKLPYFIYGEKVSNEIDKYYKNKIVKLSDIKKSPKLKFLIVSDITKNDEKLDRMINWLKGFHPNKIQMLIIAGNNKENLLISKNAK